MNNLEQQEARVSLTKKIDDWLANDTEERTFILPDNAESLMADAAFAVYLAFEATEAKIEEENEQD